MGLQRDVVLVVATAFVTALLVVEMPHYGTVQDGAAGSSDMAQGRSLLANPKPMPAVVKDGRVINQKGYLQRLIGAITSGDKDVHKVQTIAGPRGPQGPVPDIYKNFAVGSAKASKVVVLDSSKNYAGVNDLSVATLTASSGATVSAGGLTVTAGGATVTDGGLTVTAGGATVTSGGLTVTAGGLTVSAGTLTAAGGLTVSAGAVSFPSGATDIVATPSPFAINAGAVVTLEVDADVVLDAATYNGKIIMMDIDGLTAARSLFVPKDVASFFRIVFTTDQANQALAISSVTAAATTTPAARLGGCITDLGATRDCSTATTTTTVTIAASLTKAFDTFEIFADGTNVYVNSFVTLIGNGATDIQWS